MAENKKDVRYQSDEGRPELVDGGRSQEAIIGFAGGEALVPQFNKKEVEQIAKGVADESADVSDLKKEIKTKVTFFEVSNITSIDKDILNEVKSGDVIVKITGNQRHSYRVSYKENGQGICLTYSDASVVETVSYDKSGNDWVYNSTDKTNLFNNPLTTPNDIIVAGSNGTPQRLPVGTAGQFLKCGTTGVMWGDIPSGSGTQLYKHTITAVVRNVEAEPQYDLNLSIVIISNSNTPITASNLFNLPFDVISVSGLGTDNVDIYANFLSYRTDGIDGSYICVDFDNPSAYNIDSALYTITSASDVVTAL